MSATRDKLISDWRERLAAAQAELVSSSPRRAWMVRVRTRLYRFLLSLYGDGAWRADDSPPSEAATAVETSAVVFDLAEAASLAGKRAKGEDQMRAVLKSVASAQEVRQASGPWASGVADGEWVVVARQSSDLDLESCMRLLGASGIICRWMPDGPTAAIIVPAALAELAHAKIAANRSSLRPRPSRVVVPTAAATRLPLLLLIGSVPMIAVVSFLITSAASSDAMPDSAGWTAAAQGLAILAALYALVFLVRPIGHLVQRVDRWITTAIASRRKRCRSKGPQS